MKALCLTLALILPTTAPAAEPTIFAGESTSFAIDSGGVAYGWGRNGSGEIGTPAGLDTKRPGIVMSGIRTIAPGITHTLFLDTRGGAYATGAGTFGELGIDPFISGPSRKTPDKVLTGVKAIAAGSMHSIFLKTDGSVWACGSGRALGLSPQPPVQYIPAKVTTGIKDVVSVSSGSFYLTGGGSVWATSFGTDPADANRPIRHIMDGVKSISPGVRHILFLRKDNTAWAVGAGVSSQFPNVPDIGFEEPFTTPIQVMSGVKAIAAGYDSSFFIKSDDSLWATGSNFYGQLGDGTTSDRHSPVRVLTRVGEVSAGFRHTIVRKTDGSVWTAGENVFGQLGDGTLTSRPTFARTAAFPKPAGPEIVIQRSADLQLADGATKESFGTLQVGKKGSSRKYQIKNIGTKPLTGLAIRIDGAHAKDFVFTKPAATTVKPGQSTTFTVTFKPVKTGTRTAAIHIKSNDQDETPFDFNLTGLSKAR